MYSVGWAEEYIIPKSNQLCPEFDPSARWCCRRRVHAPSPSIFLILWNPTKTNGSNLSDARVYRDAIGHPQLAASSLFYSFESRRISNIRTTQKISESFFPKNPVVTWGSLFIWSAAAAGRVSFSLSTCTHRAGVPIRQSMSWKIVERDARARAARAAQQSSFQPSLCPTRYILSAALTLPSTITLRHFARNQPFSLCSL